MKKIIFIFFIFLISSCSKTIYYEYLDKETKNYFILEIDEKSQTTRFIGTDNRSNSLSHNYIEINGDWEFLDANKKDNVFYHNIKNINFSNIINRLYYYDDCVNMESKNTLSYKGYKGKDSISLLTLSAEKLINNDSCTKSLKINFFPPYLKKTKKIDYNKFPENIRDIVIFKENSNDSHLKFLEVLKKRRERDY